MPSEDYVSVTSGALKLKGVNPSGKVGKHKKKRPKAPDTGSNSTHADAKAKEDPGQGQEQGEESSNDGKQTVMKEVDQNEASREDLLPSNSGKTEAELRHGERRRKRLDERLKREGTKTHKERVEELNRYLSNLSEHHDMPRIGPG